MQFRTYAPAVLLMLIGFAIAWQFVDPAPPRTVVIATGHEGGAYYLYAQRYQKLLAEEGIELEILTTAGSLENIRLLEDRSAGVDLAFVQGGTASATDSADIVSLGSLYYEPLWVLYRSGEVIDRLAWLADKRVAAGEAGSGTRAVALTLLNDNGLDAASDNSLALGGQDAVQALIAGEVDAAFFVASPRATLVQELLGQKDIQLMSFTRAAAYTRRHHFLSSLVLPEGVVDLQQNIPPLDTVLLAATANLAANSDFHPALINLFLQVLSRVHGEGGVFENPGEFPNEYNVDFPLNDDARRYYRDGPPFLQRYLPFWTANLIDRLKIMLVPVITLLIPLFKVMPPAYRWRVRKKIYRWYRELQELDIEHPQREKAERLARLLQRLNDIEEEVRKVRVPLSYVDELYDLRVHIDLLRDKLTAVSPAS